MLGIRRRLKRLPMPIGVKMPFPMTEWGRLLDIDRPESTRIGSQRPRLPVDYPLADTVGLVQKTGREVEVVVMNGL